MKKSVFKIKIYICSIVVILISSIVISLFGFSVAAYLNSEQQRQTININMDYSSYFDDTSNPSSKKYVISTSEHLRNLSKLVSVGAFTPDFTFVLKNSFTYEGEPLIPIGSDNTPFYSTFDGQGYTIRNLAVVGSDLADVGMFGYVANGALIKNFLLDYPYVSAKGTYLTEQYTTDAFAIRDNNPFRAKFGTDLDTLAKSVTLNVLNSTDETKEFDNFSITSTKNENIPFNVKTYVNKPGFVKSDDGINFTKDSTYSEASSYFTVEAYIEGLVEINGEYFYSRYTLERFKIYYKTTENNGNYTPVGFVQNSGDPKCYRKTIEVLPTHIANGTKTYNYYNQHVVFAGIVCGHLDGQAEYIGVNNGSLYADNRAFRSNSILIGKRIDDDDYSSLSKEYIHVDKAMITELTWTSGAEKTLDSETSNMYISNIYSDGSSNNFSANAIDYVRIYGSQSQNDNTGGIRLEELNIDDNSTKTLAFYDSIDCYMGIPTTGAIVNYGTNSMYKSNCISMWVTMDSASGFGNVVSELLSQSGDFYLKFKFNYVLFDSIAYETGTKYSDLKIKLFGGQRNKSPVSGWLHNHRYYTSGYKSDSDGNTEPHGKYFALGVNENSAGDGRYTIRTGYIDTKDYYNSLNFKLDERVPLGTTNITKSNIFEKEIVFVSNSSYFNFDYSIAKRTPLICFGFDIPVDSNGNPTAKINLIDFTVTLSSIKGNFASDPLTVDYYTSSSNAPSYKSGSWSNWPLYSNVKVGINCFSEFVPDSSYTDESVDDDGKVTSGKFNVTYPLMSENPYLPSIYKVVMTRSGNGVASSGTITCTYTMDAASSNHIPKNAEGYIGANIVAG